MGSYDEVFAEGNGCKEFLGGVKCFGRPLFQMLSLSQNISWEARSSTESSPTSGSLFAFTFMPPWIILHRENDRVVFSLFFPHTNGFSE